MPIKVVCPSCGRTLNARDEHAGKKLKCPGCAAAVTVPAAPPAQQAGVDDLEEMEPAPRDRGRPARRDDDYDDRRPSRRDDYDRDDDRDYDRPPPRPNPFARQGLTNAGTILLFCGLGLLLLLLISVFFPWRSVGVGVEVPRMPGMPGGMDFGRGMGLSVSASGLNIPGGIITLILSILAAAFVVVALFALNQLVFKISLWTAFGMSLACGILALLAAVVRRSVGPVSEGGAWGAWVAMIVALGAAALFIVTALSLRSVAMARPRRSAAYDDDRDDDREED